MKQTIKILIVEHSSEDIELITNELNAAGIVHVLQTVQNEPGYIDALNNFCPDIILSDFSLPSFDGPTAFTIRQQLAPDVPFIFVSGNIGEERSIEYLKAGVTDYVLKDKLFTLASKVNRALLETEEKQQKINAAKALRKANRLYAFISKINQTIVHVKEEALLFETACKIAVEFGKFEVAWIGLLNTEFKTVSIGGQAGIADEDIFLVDNVPYNPDGPQQQILTTENYFICNNIQKDFSLDSWKRIAQKYNIHSFTVLPIRRNGTVIGSLNLYSSEYSFFDKEEITLLAEIAVDISFAIDMMDTVKKQYQSEALIAFKAELLNTIGQAVISTDVDGTINFWNKAAEELYGWKSSEAICKNLAELIPVHKTKKQQEERSGKLTSLQSWSGEYMAQQKDGSSFPVFVTDSPLYNKEGILSCIISVSYDITQRKKAEATIAESELRYRQIVETAHEGIWMVDENNRTTFINKKMCDMLEYSESDMMGRTMDSFRDTSGQLSDQFHSMLRKKGSRESGEINFITRNKKKVLTLVSTNAIVAEDGSYKGTLSMITDITEKIKLENLLNEASEMARIGSWEVDLRNDTVYYSDMTKEIHELAADYIPDLSRSIDFYKEGANRERIRQVIQAAADNCTCWDEELEIITAKQNERWIRSIGKTESVNGKCIRMNGSFQDITARKLDEIQLRCLNENLVQQSEALEVSNNFLAASERSYSDLFQLSPQPMCLYKMDSFRFIKVNKAAIEHYGYNEEELLSMTLLDLVPEEDRKKAIANIAGQKRKLNKTYTGLSKNYKKNGDIIEVETFSTPIIINGEKTTLVIAVDVTEKNLFDHKIIKAIIKTQEDERYEIGGELHDNVCQILAASQMTLGVFKESLSTANTQLLQQGMEYITLASSEIRNLSHRLAPVFFSESTMEEAFRKLFNTFTIDEKIQIVLDFDASVTRLRLSVEIQLNLYRILQEQMRNILKYAKATQVEVDVVVYNNRLKMRIADNGVGFDMEAAKRGIGINNMKRRAELFAGKFEIETSPGQGCVVIVDIPLG